MTTVDVVIIAIALFGVVRGLMTGLVRQIVDVAGFIVALILALELMPFLAERVVAPLGIDGLAAKVVAFLLVFVVLEIAFMFVARLVEKGIGLLRLSFLNRLGGGLVGMAKTVLLTSVALVLLARFEVPSEEARRDSALYGPTVLLVPSAWDLAAAAWPRIQTLSEKFGDEVRSYWTEAE